MDPAVFGALEHCLAGNRSPGWAARAHKRRRRPRAASIMPQDAFETEAMISPVRRQRSSRSGGRMSSGSLGSVEGLFGRYPSRSVTPMLASRVAYLDDALTPTQQQSRPSSGHTTRSPAHLKPHEGHQPVSPVSPDSRPETPSMSSHPVSKKPLPEDFLSQPWVQKYLHEIPGLLSIQTLEGLAARWELERSNPVRLSPL